jgi:hypothetical protein
MVTIRWNARDAGNLTITCVDQSGVNPQPVATLAITKGINVFEWTIPRNVFGSRKIKIENTVTNPDGSTSTHTDLSDVAFTIGDPTRSPVSAINGTIAPILGSQGATLIQKNLIKWENNGNNNTTSYDVYLGTNADSLVLKGTTNSTSLEIDKLPGNEIYYVMIVAKNSYGQTESPVWQLVSLNLRRYYSYNCTVNQNPNTCTVDTTITMVYAYPPNAIFSIDWRSIEVRAGGPMGVSGYTYRSFSVTGAATVQIVTGGCPDNTICANVTGTTAPSIITLSYQ